MVELKTAPTFVLVHGAWADGTSWHKVIDALEAAGARAVAAPIPLTSVSDDVRALDRCLTRIEGPVVLAAHAYAGAVISGSKNERVKGLVCFYNEFVERTLVDGIEQPKPVTASSHGYY